MRHILALPSCTHYNVGNNSTLHIHSNIFRGLERIKVIKHYGMISISIFQSILNIFRMYLEKNKPLLKSTTIKPFYAHTFGERLNAAARGGAWGTGHWSENISVSSDRIFLNFRKVQVPVLRLVR